jgi:hypothetical protein
MPAAVKFMGAAGCTHERRSGGKITDFTNSRCHITLHSKQDFERMNSNRTFPPNEVLKCQTQRRKGFKKDGVIYFINTSKLLFNTSLGAVNLNTELSKISSRGT